MHPLSNSGQRPGYGYIFTQPNYYSQTLLKFTSGAFLGGAGGAANPAMGVGLQSLPPEQIASIWYDKIMAGESGLLAKMTFSDGESRVSFSDLMATLFAPYPNIDSVYSIAPQMPEKTETDRNRSFASPYTRLPPHEESPHAVQLQFNRSTR